jgi:hypothetical protein
VRFRRKKLADQLCVGRRELRRPSKRLQRLPPFGGTHGRLLAAVVADDEVGDVDQSIFKRTVDAQFAAGLQRTPSADVVVALAQLVECSWIDGAE